MMNREPIHEAATGDPTPPASSAGQSTALKGAALIALMFMVGAPATYAVRASLDASTTAEATLWISPEPAAEQRADAAEREGDAPDPGAAWAALVHSRPVLEGAGFTASEVEVIQQGLSTHLNRGGQLLRLRLEGTDGQAAEILDRLVVSYVEVANGLKQAKLQEAVEATDQAVWAVETELLAAAESGSQERIEAGERLHAAMVERHGRARLAAESWIPDVRVLDQARMVRR